MRRFYDNDNDADEDDLSGFTVYDDEGNEHLADKINQKKEDYVHFDESEQAKYFSPLPQNQITAMLDKPLSLAEGTELVPYFTSDGGRVEYEGNIVGNFKPALVARLYEMRRDQFVIASAVSGGLVKLEFFEQRVKGSIKMFN